VRRGRFLVGAVVIFAAVAYLVYAGIRETSVYYLTIDEFLNKKETLVGQGVRVAGRVQHGTMHWNATSLDLAFGLGGFQPEGKAAAAARSPVPVHYRGILPDMFAEGRDVIVEGIYGNDGTFAANTILTSCPSKYEPDAPAS
jgi:cytochrome c-type biogenesis protein CcmE